jgi:hypothetical protein
MKGLELVLSGRKHFIAIVWHLSTTEKYLLRNSAEYQNTELLRRYVYSLSNNSSFMLIQEVKSLKSTKARRMLRETSIYDITIERKPLLKARYQFFLTPPFLKVCLSARLCQRKQQSEPVIAHY